MNAPSKEDRRRHFNAVGDALTAFQMIEESLKRSISLCYTYIRSRVRNQFPFGYTRADVENAPLGTLLDIYRRLSPNKDLLVALKALPKDRNYVAHQAFVQGIINVDDAPDQFSADTERIEQIARNAYVVLGMMIEEMNLLEARVRSAVDAHDG